MHEPSSALAALAAAALAAREVISAARDLDGLERAQQLIGLFVRRQLLVHPSEMPHYGTMTTREGFPPPDYGILAALMAHQVQMVQHLMHRSPMPASSLPHPIQRAAS